MGRDYKGIRGGGEYGLQGNMEGMDRDYRGVRKGL